MDLQELTVTFYQGFVCHIDVNGSPQSQHDFIFTYLIPVFQSVFSEIKYLITSLTSIQHAQNLNFDNISLNINEQWNWDNFFKYLSMNGLHLCDSFTQNINNNPEQNYLYQSYNSYTNSFSKNCD